MVGFAQGEACTIASGRAVLNQFRSCSKAEEGKKKTRAEGGVPLIQAGGRILGILRWGKESKPPLSFSDNDDLFRVVEESSRNQGKEAWTGVGDTNFWSFRPRGVGGMGARPPLNEKESGHFKEMSWKSQGRTDGTCHEGWSSRVSDYGALVTHRNPTIREKGASIGKFNSLVPYSRPYRSTLWESRESFVKILRTISISWII